WRVFAPVPSSFFFDSFSQKLGCGRPTDSASVRCPATCLLDFARRFIEWNAVDHGIQRVDACRAPDGELLLVELEDLNPYLSLDALDDPARDAFVAALRTALRRLLAA
ncbi:hypothetical protein ACFUAE_30355, partial [Streptomyces ardesiacus]